MFAISSVLSKILVGLLFYSMQETGTKNKIYCLVLETSSQDDQLCYPFANKFLLLSLVNYVNYSFLHKTKS